ncbi:MAG: hypothetical protein LBI26_02125 [Holosporales bacterium]|jgi:hypothetical protein|nr:hypothetical protein [Holosporales bacterium]
MGRFSLTGPIQTRRGANYGGIGERKIKKTPNDTIEQEVSVEKKQTPKIASHSKRLPFIGTGIAVPISNSPKYFRGVLPSNAQEDIRAYRAFGVGRRTPNPAVISSPRSGEIDEDVPTSRAPAQRQFGNFINPNSKSYPTPPSKPRPLFKIKKAPPPRENPFRGMGRTINGPERPTISRLLSKNPQPILEENRNQVVDKFLSQYDENTDQTDDLQNKRYKPDNYEYKNKNIPIKNLFSGKLATPTPPSSRFINPISSPSSYPSGSQINKNSAQSFVEVVNPPYSEPKPKVRNVIPAEKIPSPKRVPSPSLSASPNNKPITLYSEQSNETKSGGPVAKIHRYSVENYNDNVKRNESRINELEKDRGDFVKKQAQQQMKGEKLYDKHIYKREVVDLGNSMGSVGESEKLVKRLRRPSTPPPVYRDLERITLTPNITREENSFSSENNDFMRGINRIDRNISFNAQLQKEFEEGERQKQEAANQEKKTEKTREGIRAFK